jgi:hypothetical protein
MSVPPEEQPPASVPPARGGFGSLRALGECQLQVQFTVSSAYDTQAMGILGLNAALAAAAVAGDKLLGHQWWLALIGLFVSSVLAGSALFMRADKVGLDLTEISAIAEGVSGDEMDRAIVTALTEDIDDNDDALAEKRDRVWVAMLTLLATVLGAIIGVLAF